MIKSFGKWANSWQPQAAKEILGKITISQNWRLWQYFDRFIRNEF